MPNTEALKAQKRELITRFARADERQAFWQAGSTLILLAVTWWLVSLGFQQGWLWVIPPTLLMSCVLLRIFVLMHDCGHMSLFRSRRHNQVFGFLFGVISGMPQYVWAQHHNFHHATNGNWDQYRGPLATLSTDEYEALSDQQQKSYVRNRRIFLAPFAGLLYMVISPRVNWIRGMGALLIDVLRGKRQQTGAPMRQLAAAHESRVWASSAEFWHMTLNNLVLLPVWVLMSLWLGPVQFFAVYLVSNALAGGAGIVLFAVQHNFENSHAVGDATWDYDTAALVGTSYLDLPPWLRWCTGNIGYHHVHHLSARIPNYHLAACHQAYSHLFESVPRLRLADVPHALRCILWDRSSDRIISVAEHEARLAAI